MPSTATSAVSARRARFGRRFLRRLEIERLGERPVGVFADQQLAHEVDRQIGVFQSRLADQRPEQEIDTFASTFTP